MKWTKTFLAFCLFAFGIASAKSIFSSSDGGGSNVKSVHDVELTLDEILSKLEQFEQMFKQEEMVDFLQNGINPNRDDLKEQNDFQTQHAVKPKRGEPNDHQDLVYSLEDLVLLWEKTHRKHNDRWNPKRSGLSFARL